MDQTENQFHYLGVCGRLLNCRLLTFLAERFTAAVTLVTTTVLACFLCRGLAVCRWPFELFIQNLTAQATKTVTLGPPANHGSQNRSCQLVAREWPGEGIISSQANIELEQEGDSTVVNEEGKELPPIEDGGVGTVSTLKFQERAHSHPDDEKKHADDVGQRSRGPPKKMVSINEVAEVVYTSSTKDTKRKKTTGKSPSNSMEDEMGEEPKPLKPILKVGSNASNKQETERARQALNSEA